MSEYSEWLNVENISEFTLNMNEKISNTSSRYILIHKNAKIVSKIYSIFLSVSILDEIIRVN